MIAFRQRGKVAVCINEIGPQNIDAHRAELYVRMWCNVCGIPESTTIPRNSPRNRFGRILLWVVSGHRHGYFAPLHFSCVRSSVPVSLVGWLLTGPTTRCMGAFGGHQKYEHVGSVRLVVVTALISAYCVCRRGRRDFPRTNHDS